MNASSFSLSLSQQGKLRLTVKGLDVLGVAHDVGGDLQGIRFSFFFVFFDFPISGFFSSRRGVSSLFLSLSLPPLSPSLLPNPFSLFRTLTLSSLATSVTRASGLREQSSAAAAVPATPPPTTTAAPPSGSDADDRGTSASAFPVPFASAPSFGSSICVQRERERERERERQSTAMQPR